MLDFLSKVAGVLGETETTDCRLMTESGGDMGRTGPSRDGSEPADCLVAMEKGAGAWVEEKEWAGGGKVVQEADVGRGELVPRAGEAGVVAGPARG